MSVLADKLLAIHHALGTAGLPHAFGGAIALAYCTDEPRGTRDVDVNVFVPPATAGVVLDRLPAGIVAKPSDHEVLARDGRVRLWWDETPVGLFLDTDDFHLAARAAVRIVEFAGERIPVLGCDTLAVFKVFSDRRKDWADLEAMLTSGTVDRAAVSEWLGQLLGADDERVTRWAALLAEL